VQLSQFKVHTLVNGSVLLEHPLQVSFNQSVLTKVEFSTIQNGTEQEQF